MPCPRPAILTAVVAAAAMFITGCGGGSSPGVANLGNSTSTSPSSSSSSGAPPTQAQLQKDQQEATRFAQCMRSHGVAIPNPTVSPRAFKNAFNTQSPGFQSAYTVCGHLLPAGRQQNQPTVQTQKQTLALLAFARCLRGHGFANFPDPADGGQLTHEMVARAGIDLHDPAVVQAADACTSVTHGVITRAIVAHFVAGH
jgi:hypothetical protein